MQPNNNNADKWRQPSEQPSQAPHVIAPTPEPLQQPSPIVTLSPETVNPTKSDDAPAPLPEQGITNEDVETVTSPPASQTEPVHWQAYEYIPQDKNPLWFTIFGVVVVGLIIIAIFLLKSVTFAVLIPVMAVALVVYSKRPPRLLNYTISSQGLHVNDRLYPFIDFKGFGVIHDGSEYSILLIPRKRFKPGTSVYFPEEAGEAIVDMLGARLPMQELHVDMVDKLVHKLRI